MGAGTWATVALEQGLPYFGVALTAIRDHEAMGHLKGEAGSAEKLFFVIWSQSGGICGLLKNVCCTVATRYALTTPTPVLYMESLAAAAKGKAKAAGGEAEREEEEREGGHAKNNLAKETKSSSSDSSAEPASLAQRGCAPTRLRACSSALARRC